MYLSTNPPQTRLSHKPSRPKSHQCATLSRAFCINIHSHWVFQILHLNLEKYNPTDTLRAGCKMKNICSYLTLFFEVQRFLCLIPYRIQWLDLNQHTKNMFLNLCRYFNQLMVPHWIRNAKLQKSKTKQLPESIIWTSMVQCNNIKSKC